MIHTIKVTEFHIATGKKRKCGLCPVALALTDHFNTPCSVGYSFGRIGPENVSTWKIIEIPKETAALIRAFDDGHYLSPFSFEVEL